jgi:hypothetical protein
MALDSAMTWKKGGCHCGAVCFEVLMPDEVEAVDCNCSMCAKTGYVHYMVPKDRFRLLTGADKLTTYEFNTKTAKHLFCSVCGIKSFYVPRSHPDGYSINLRCLEPNSVRVSNMQPFDGAHWEQHITELKPLEAN